MATNCRNWRTSAALAAVMIALVGAPWAARAAEATKDNPNEWPVYGRTQANTRFSPLAQINAKNVSRLKLAYTLQLGSLRANEATPIVVGDTLYVSTSWGPKSVFALDAATGVRKWAYEPELPNDIMQFACCDVDSRGVTYSDGKIFLGRLDGFLVALDAATGKELWKTQVVDYKQGSAITSPPLVIGDIVITGFAGGEFGVRGSLQAFEIATGKEIWRTFTTALPGEPNGDSWTGDGAAHGGGSTWNVGSYDAATDTVFWGTSNPSPTFYGQGRVSGTPDIGKVSNLYTSSTLALDPHTGKIKWWQQGTPQDSWDYDGVNEPVLADLKIDGQSAPVFMKADRNGFFFVVNRNDGKLISADKFTNVTWAKNYDVAAGKPVEAADKRLNATTETKDVCPSWMGGKNWQPMSFNPETKLVYFAANNMCMDIKGGEVGYRRGVYTIGVADLAMYPGPGGYAGDLLAWDPVKKSPAWEVKQPLPFNGGTMTTAGNLVFFGDISGWFHAFDATSGKDLWKFNVGSGVGAGAMSYSVGGKQYVAIVVGRSATLPAYMGDMGKGILSATPEGGALLVFSL
jgi:alcohol dehydrogenase (cytochrome c)